MSGWSVFWAGVKGFFCPGTSAFEEIVKLALDRLNSAIANSGAAEWIAKTCGVAKDALALLEKYKGWCPTRWAGDYARVLAVVSAVVRAFDDGRLDGDELVGVVREFQVAYAEWNA